MTMIETSFTFNLNIVKDKQTCTCMAFLKVFWLMNTMCMYLFIRRGNQSNTSGGVLDVSILLKDTSASCHQTQDHLFILWGQQMDFLSHDCHKASTSKTLRVQDKPSPNSGQTNSQWQWNLKNHLTTERSRRAKEDWASRSLMWHYMLGILGYS